MKKENKKMPQDAESVFRDVVEEAWEKVNDKVKTEY